MGGLFDLTYLPNTTNNLGIGATYKSITLNLAYGFGFLNPDKGRGTTKYLDLQFHRYGRKVILDAFGQFYKGYYLGPKGYGTSNGNYYLRPDLSVNELGASVQYVFNSKRFSYQASFLQNEWQKKSAGTFLLGVEGYFGNVRTDSSFFPTALDSSIAAKNYRQVNFGQLGPNAGYAYTLVVKRHFFLTGSASLGLNLGHTTVKKEGGDTRGLGVGANTFFRIAAGYNSYLWAVSLIYVSNNVQLVHSTADDQFQLNTANIRLNFVHRFTLGKKGKKLLEDLN